MAKSTATTVQEYLDELPEERRTVVAAVRDVIVRNLPPGYEEVIRWGMISYEIPLSHYPKTYNGQPLPYLSLAAQKNYYALYISSAALPGARAAVLRAAFEAAGKKLDMGKACLRFKRLDDVPWDEIGDVVAGTPPDAYIADYEAARQR